VEELTTTTGIVAMAGAAIAVIALLAVLVMSRRLARLRADQRVVFGDKDARDLVTHAAGLDRDFRALHSYVEDLSTGLQARLATVEQRLDGAISHHGLVRYDAYNEMSGRQSTSIALLDARGSGVVVSSIHHRDQARLYAKQVIEGQGQLELSPEEQEAVRVALAGEVPDRAEQRR
jgi:Protein of unknown function (DUF4446)